jgi:hypothetical protein
LSFLPLLQRKSGAEPPDKPSKKKRDAASAREGVTVVNPVLAGIYNRSSRHVKKQPPPASSESTANTVTASTAARTACAPTSGAMIGAHQALARRAVGKGIRHNFGGPASTTTTTQPFTAQLPPSTHPVNSLAELASNYQTSLLKSSDDEVLDENEDDDDPTPLSQMQGRVGSYFDDNTGAYAGLLSRNSSLIDLAMIAPVDDDDTMDESSSMAAAAADTSTRGFGFVDFPNPEVHPSASRDSEGMHNN